jgi:hypothetical protein
MEKRGRIIDLESAQAIINSFNYDKKLWLLSHFRYMYLLELWELIIFFLFLALRLKFR